MKGNIIRRRARTVFYYKLVDAESRINAGRLMEQGGG